MVECEREFAEVLLPQQGSAVFRQRSDSMTISRRTFVQQTSAAASAASVIRPQASAVVNQPPSAQGDPSFKLLAMLGLDAARSAGATYADIRIVDLRTQAVRARDLEFAWSWMARGVLPPARQSIARKSCGLRVRR